MRSLFEKEEKEIKLNQLKVDLISRFYSFSNDEILKYKGILNFDRYLLMENEHIQWNSTLLKQLQDKIDWTAIWKLKKLNIDLPFFIEFESLIDFQSIHLSNNIEWNEKIIEKYGDRLDWSKSLINRKPLSTIENLRKYKDSVDWTIVSRGIKLNFTNEVFDEFYNNWNWKSLSANVNLPISETLIKNYADKLDFDELSKNPSSLPIIFKNPTFEKWNWDQIIINSGIIYNLDTYNYIFPYYKSHYESNVHVHPLLKKRALQSFLYKIFLRSPNDVSYFFNNQFYEQFPWDALSKRNNLKLTIDFIEKYKDKLNLKEDNLIRSNKEIITTEFILNNFNLFNTEHYSFYKLPLTINLIDNYIQNINWNYLSRCDKLDWNWNFIEKHLYDFNYFQLTINKGIYQNLFSHTMPHENIISFLNKSA